MFECVNLKVISVKTSKSFSNKKEKTFQNIIQLFDFIN